MPDAVDDAQWFKVLLALRWPCAVVASSAVLGGVLLHVLSKPIPIRIALPPDQPLPVRAEVKELAQPIRVEQLNEAIEIRAQEVLTVRGSVGIDTKAPIPISGEPRVVVTNPVEVKASAPLAVQGNVAVKAAEPLPVQASVDVSASEPLPVKGSVEVDTPNPLQVTTEVTLDTDEDPIQVQVKEGLLGIF
ncbi:hypothetical protein [Cyanobium sp. NS01]|uniref:hypothetical protein n=1 Tax=Cyanobium sp. NS01 TaxID=261284 RepID=UPI0016487F77|nr:hypothetical protein [Cyanobium sp. NS01]QNI71579.1 putative conserved secreted protein [Cyanobium sp. NS01]